MLVECFLAFPFLELIGVSLGSLHIGLLGPHIAVTRLLLPLGAVGIMGEGELILKVAVFFLDVVLESEALQIFQLQSLFLFFFLLLIVVGRLVDLAELVGILDEDLGTPLFATLVQAELLVQPKGLQEARGVLRVPSPPTPRNQVG
eukprot:CAMPEP_0170554834 /NCGR_PEP_ID=MMETSP0211-20121228/12704_2 /TAXON_ID=311385 /ORGANISM="Pseudokeronopsis sp., Strain OXSARD2" /LENGTH=145 /DNA_ID=CAMNT_0010864205 /DNA_START=2302 /DNA_END=2739 /DNA_ORIENTATION=-